MKTIIFQFNISIFTSFQRSPPSLLSTHHTIILNCFQELINTLLNLQTTYPIEKKSFQNIITDIVKQK